MIAYKTSTTITVPVVLTVATTGAAHTGVAAGSVSVTVIKSNGTTSSYTPTAGQWTEYSADAYTSSGYYNLVIPDTATDQAGILQYGVSVSGDDKHFGVVYLVANLESETYTRIGAPVGASISADIAGAITSIKGASNKDITQVDTAISGAVVSIKGSGDKDLTQVDTDVNAVGSAVSMLSSSVARILALSYDNIHEDSQTYDGDGRLTSARFRAYDTAAHALAGGVTGLLYTYTIGATYDGSGHCTKFTMTRA